MLSLASLASLLLLSIGVQAGTKLWDGSFNAFQTAADFDKCEFSVVCIITVLCS